MLYNKIGANHVSRAIYTQKQTAQKNFFVVNSANENIQTNVANNREAD